jgi:hypothetical protein
MIHWINMWMFHLTGIFIAQVINIGNKNCYGLYIKYRSAIVHFNSSWEFSCVLIQKNCNRAKNLSGKANNLMSKEIEFRNWSVTLGFSDWTLIKSRLNFICNQRDSSCSHLHPSVFSSWSYLVNDNCMDNHM